MVKQIIIAKARRIGATLSRIRRKCDKIIIHFLLPLLVKPETGKYDLRCLGDGTGAWTVPVNLLRKSSNCYCVGVGSNVSFDIALVEEFGCNVYSFDPTPSSIDYMDKLQYDLEHLKFLPIGVWDEDTELRFYTPADPKGCHSVYDLHGTGKYFIAKCKKLSSIMKDFGHDHIDLLKLDIEGAWRRVVQNIISENLDISILCVELDSPTSLFRALRLIRKLKDAGFVLVHFEKDNYIFVKESLIH